MLSTSSSYRSADAGSVHAAGLRCFPCGLQDADDLSRLIDAQLYAAFTHPAAIDPRLLLLNHPPALRVDTYLPCHPDLSFSSSLGNGWPQEPYAGEYNMPETQSSPVVAESARSFSPGSDASMLSDGGSLASDLGFGAGPSSAGPSGVAAPTAVGPVRRGRGRPRKDAPPVFQPPPLCTYVDPLTHAPCAKLLNRHHDLPRHMVKHCQDEAAMVKSGMLPRELATLLPTNWNHADELKLPCRFCTATFSRSDAVTRHEKREHKHRPRKG